MGQLYLRCFAVLLLLQMTSVTKAQILPKFIEQELRLAGIEYFDQSVRNYTFNGATGHSWYNYDYRINNHYQDVTVRVELAGEPRYFDMAETIKSIAYQSRHVEIRMAGEHSLIAQKYRAERVWVADFRPRAFFRRSRCRLVYFYTDLGALVRIGYFYNKDFPTYDILRCKALRSSQ